MVFARSSFACVLSYIYDKKKLIVRCIQYAGIYGKSLKLLKISLPCKGCLFDVVHGGDGLRAHEAAKPLLMQFQQSITCCFEVSLIQIT